MDLTKRAELSAEERFRLASDLHAMLLDETFRATRWKLGDAVFHGGTSLRVGWQSERISEDLDFMVADTALAALGAAAPRVVERIRHRATATWPGCVIEVRAKTSSPEEQDHIDVWDVKWTHPKRIGKVLVKLEFYRVVDRLLADYRARMVLPVADGRGGVRITTPFPIAEMTSLWGDKVKAIGTRPAFKHRDAYDLAFIVDRLTMRGEMPNDDALRATLAHVAAIYGKTTDDVAHGLTVRLEDGSFDDVAAFKDNMARWFEPETYAAFDERAMFEEMLSIARAEVERGRDLLATPAPAYGAR